MTPPKDVVEEVFGKFIDGRPLTPFFRKFLADSIIAVLEDLKKDNLSTMLLPQFIFVESIDAAIAKVKRQR